MDSLHSIADATFRSCIFHGKHSSYDVYESPSLPQQKGLRHAQRTTDQIQQAAESDAPFYLVKIQYKSSVNRHGFFAARDHCEAIAKAFNLNPYILDMIANDLSGYHCLGEDAAGACSSFYLQCAIYKCIWSYDRKRKCTRAIVFVSTSHRGHPAFHNLVDLLGENMALVSHPLFLPLSAAAQTLSHTMSLMRGHYDTCHIVEAATGYRPVEHSEVQPLVHVEKLSDMSRDMSILARETEMASRRIKQWRMALDDFARSRPHTSLLENDHRMLVSNTIGILQSKLDVMEIDFTYIGERARIQLVAISQIMTQDDTLAGIRLARAAAQDSSSMKVVAIMTMAFLPGTFFAALFSVPSLSREGNTAVQGNFWVYWAFTLPCTAIVFAIWVALTQRRQIREFLGIEKASSGGTNTNICSCYVSESRHPR